MATGDNSHRRETWEEGVVSFGGKDYPIVAGDTYSAAPVGIGTYLSTGLRYVIFWEKGDLQGILQTVLESSYDRASKNRVIIAELTAPSGSDYVEGNEVQVENKADGQASQITASSHIWKGTAAAPSYSFNKDTNTGMYSSTADQIHFSAGGTERLEVSSAGITVTGTVTATALSVGSLGNVTSTGWFRGPDGSLAAPEFSFTSDTDTGMYRASADHLSLSAGGQSITVSEAVVTSGSVHYMGIYPTNTADGTAADGTTGKPWVNLGTYPTTANGWNHQRFNGVVASYHVMAYNGTEQYPPLYFSADPDTGFYYVADGYWGFTSGGNAEGETGDQSSVYIGDHTFNITDSTGANTREVDFSAVGSLGINTSLHTGSVYPKAHHTNALGSNTRRWNILYTRDIDTTNAVVVSSDGSLKDNIQPTNLGLDFINDLNPVSYKWKDETGDTSTHYGIVAQDVVDTLNNSGIDSLDDFAGITYNTDSNLYGARYQEFIPILMKAVQELSAEIKELKEKN